MYVKYELGWQDKVALITYEALLQLHPNLQIELPPWEGDLAVATLRLPILQFGRHVTPICLPNNAFFSPDGAGQKGWLVLKLVFMLGFTGNLFFTHGIWHEYHTCILFMPERMSKSGREFFFSPKPFFRLICTYVGLIRRLKISSSSVQCSFPAGAASVGLAAVWTPARQINTVRQSSSRARTGGSTARWGNHRQI